MSSTEHFGATFREGAVAQALRTGLGALNTRERTLDDCLQQQALAAYDVYRADRSRGIAVEDVRAFIQKQSSNRR